MAGYGDKPYGLNDVKLYDDDGTNEVDLPVSTTLKFSPRVGSGELYGDDGVQSVAGIVEALEWELEAGGISLEAWAKLTGLTASETGSTPNLVMTLAVDAGDNMPYIRIAGKSLGDGDDDVHVYLYKAKCLSVEGQFAGKTFFVTKCSGIAVTDGTNGIFKVLQNETAAALSWS
jgi:hypothetical protein